MIIGIISDTHENVPNVEKAVKIFNERKCKMVLHLGDVISPKTLTFFEGLKNFKFIKGNCDGDIPMMKQLGEKFGAEYLGEKAELELDGKKFLLMHSFPEHADISRYDYVLHGHNHKKRNEKISNTRVINPGAHYYQAENTIAVLDTKKDDVEFIEVK